MADTKDTIYIDVDEEITGIIDKVTASKHKIVALVLPKRCTVLQSIVNMKLLKRKADLEKKNLVLITSESGLLPLAGAVKLHVAKTLQSKPAIPSAPKIANSDLEMEDSKDSDDLDQVDSDDVADEVDEPVIDKSKPIAAYTKPDTEETIEMEDSLDSENETDDNEKDKKSKNKTAKTPKIPNFDKFRKKTLLIGGAIILLISFWIYSITVMPKAKIVIKTDNISVNSNFDFTANTAQKELDLDKSLVPALEKSVKKTDTEKVSATGQKNIGDKATGTVTIRISKCAKDNINIPAGTTVSNGSLSFITQTDVTLTAFPNIGNCANDNPALAIFTTKTVKVTAANSGEQYNISGGRAFTVNGYSEASGIDSSAMSGGTDKIVKVVSDTDVNAAKAKLVDKSKDAANEELKQQFSEDYFVIEETFAAAAPEITTTPNIGDESSDVTVTSNVTYVMLAVKTEDINKLVEKSVEKQIDTEKQKIADNGLSKAVIKVSEKKSPTEQKISVQTTASTGAQINEDELKKEIAGKKKGDVRDMIGKRPGIKEVDVNYSPLWVSTAPKNPKKITIVFEQVDGNN